MMHRWRSVMMTVRGMMLAGELVVMDFEWSPVVLVAVRASPFRHTRSVEADAPVKHAHGVLRIFSGRKEHGTEASTASIGSRRDVGS